MSSESFTLTPGLVGSVSGVGSGKTGSVTPEASSEKRTPFFSGAGGGIAKPSDFLGAGGGMRSASVPAGHGDASAQGCRDGGRREHSATTVTSQLDAPQGRATEHSATKNEPHNTTPGSHWKGRSTAPPFRCTPAQPPTSRPARMPG